MSAMNSPLQLAQDFQADVALEETPIKNLVELTPLVDPTDTLKLIEAPVKLPTEPVIYRTGDHQCEVINAGQVMMGADIARLHPDSQVLVARLTDEADLPMVRLYYQILEPARLFGDIDPLIHAAYANNHLTALLRQHVLRQHPGQPITTQQLEQLCGGRVRKSTINERKRVLGYTQPGRGCKARRDNTDINETCPV